MEAGVVAGREGDRLRDVRVALENPPRRHDGLRADGKPNLRSSPAWSPDGRFIVFTGEDSNGVNLMLLNVATLETTPLTRGSDIYADPVFSPDGKSIAFVRGIQNSSRVAREGPDTVNAQDGQPPMGYHVYTIPFDNGKMGRPTQNYRREFVWPRAALFQPVRRPHFAQLVAQREGDAAHLQSRDSARLGARYGALPWNRTRWQPQE